MTEIILKIEFGGIGDHLFHTPLPRLLKQLGLADRVFLSESSAIRNKVSLDFVWGTNPFLDGFSSLPPTILSPVKTNSTALMDIIAAHHGIPNQGNELVPEIYKTIDISTKFTKNSYIDLNYTSFVGALTIFDMIGIFGLHPDHIIVNPSPMIRMLLPLRKFIFTNSLVEYVTLINSCKDFVCLTSGGASLASALNKHATVYFGYGWPQTNKHCTNTYIQYGSNGYLRHQLTRMLFKKNQIRIYFSKNK